MLLPTLLNSDLDPPLPAKEGKAERGTLVRWLISSQGGLGQPQALQTGSRLGGLGQPQAG